MKGTIQAPYKPTEACYMTAVCSTSQTLTRPESKLIFDLVRSGAGNRLTLEEGCIRVGGGVSAVRASAVVFVDTGLIETSTYLWGRLYHNDAAKTSTIMPLSKGDMYASVTIPTLIIPVVEGDLIKLHVEGNGAVRTSDTYLCVEAIA